MKIKYAEVNKTTPLHSLTSGDVFSLHESVYILLAKGIDEIRVFCFNNLELIDLGSKVKVIHKPKATLLVDGE